LSGKTASKSGIEHDRHPNESKVPTEKVVAVFQYFAKLKPTNRWISNPRKVPIETSGKCKPVAEAATYFT